MNAYEVLKERGFLEQVTDEDKVKELLSGKSVKFYTGFDATADSLTAGHLVPIMAMAHLQRAGHTPICLVGGGTTMIGDPSARTDMRKMMTVETINHNVECFKKQLSRYIDFSDDKAYMANNADWICSMNFIEFMRDIAVHFNVKHMLQAECYKSRIDKGLTFFELAYMLLQSYDFYKLYKVYDCVLEVGGNDQWSNIIGGIDLIRLKEQKQAYGLTVKLLTNSNGVKMGKSMSGAIWLDPNKTSPFDFYQYWRSIEDVKVIEVMKLLTFMELDEIAEYEKYEGADINIAKEKLAYEITAIVHGKQEADNVLSAAKAMFSGNATSDNAPTYEIKRENLKDGIEISQLLVDTGMEVSKSEAKRSIKQGAVLLAGNKIDDMFRKLTEEDFVEETIILKKGKKKVYQLKLVD